ncbi:MAG: serine/threonine protein kinase, partial [Candidatus Obscuribacterales bacterium]|nr:serine/threonine protein kinase [Candidatus Obscuribacterales bacterium]
MPEQTPLHLIENIEIIELLGQGGMSHVYKARQTQLDRIVAVKIFSNPLFCRKEAVKRFQKEAKLTSTLKHPNIVKIISFGLCLDGRPYLVMEYLDGLSLADELKQNGRIKLQTFRDVFLPALQALSQAHEAGVIHRDLKPGNIMLCKAENESTPFCVKIVDFGIAKVFGEGEEENQDLSKSGALHGSPLYMSPEQCQGAPLDGRSDLYSMACMMYESLSGEPPFSGSSNLEVMHQHALKPPPTVSELSKKIDIRKELAKVT